MKKPEEFLIKNNKTKIVNKQGPLGYVLFMSWVGALIYFVQLSDSFGTFILAVLKACVWPAYVIHNVLQVLNIR